MSTRPASAQAGLVLGERERARDAADVGAALGALLRRSGRPRRTMSEMPDASAGPQHARGSRGTRRALSEARLTTQLLITTSIDAAGSGMASMWPFRSSTFVAPEASDVPGGQREHLIGHVEPEDTSGRARRASPTAGRRCPPPEPRVEDSLARSEIGDGSRDSRSRATRAPRHRAARRRSPALYSSAPVPSPGSQQADAEVAGPRAAEAAYRSRTSLMDGRRSSCDPQLMLVSMTRQYRLDLDMTGRRCLAPTDPDVLLLQAAADPTRLSILRRLSAARGPSAPASSRPTSGAEHGAPRSGRLASRS